MKKAYIINGKELRYYPIYRDLERRGYDIKSLIFYEKYPIDTDLGLKNIFSQKVISPKEEEYLNLNQDAQVLPKRAKEYLSKIEDVSVEDLNLKEEDIVICLNEFDLYEATFLSEKFLSKKQAFSLISKHIYYRKLAIPFKKIYSLEDYNNIKEDRFFIKPSVCSFGKRGAFKITSELEKKDLPNKYSEIFNGKRLFISTPIIDFTKEIWVFTLFDADGKPYLLWFLTEEGNATFSPFEKDLELKIKEVNEKLKITSWMATIQFLLDQNGELHFIDLNPRLPGDDDWYELAYKYLTGVRLSKVVLDLILDNKKPNIYRTHKYIVEKENQNLENKKSIKVWPYTDLYKKSPVLYFKKYK